MSRRDFVDNITRMHIRLNEIIELHDYDLQHPEVLDYSQRLDRLIAVYLRYLKHLQEPCVQPPCPFILTKN